MGRRRKPSTVPDKEAGQLAPSASFGVSPSDQLVSFPWTARIVVSHVPSVSNVCLTCASWRRRTAKHAHFSDDLACNAPARRPPCVCRLTPRCVCEPTVNGGSLLFTSVVWLAQTCTFLATGGRRRDAPVQPAFACACAGTVFICLSCAKRCHRGTTALFGEQSTVRLNIVWRWRDS